MKAVAPDSFDARLNHTGDGAHFIELKLDPGGWHSLWGGFKFSGGRPSRF
jgi:hypothetical protein